MQSTDQIQGAPPASNPTNDESCRSAPAAAAVKALAAAREFRLNNFDLLRIAAATQVLVSHTLRRLDIHTPFWFVPFEPFGGVPIFFVVSGYLISASYERSGTLTNYFRNRFLRIYPGMWACLLCTLVVVSAFGFSLLRPAAIPWFFSQMAGIIYTPKFLAGFGFGSYNGSLWTIPIELQFYCLLPLVYLVASRGRRTNLVLYLTLALFVVVAFAIRSLIPEVGHAVESRRAKLLTYTFLPHFFMFMAGVALQRLKAYQSGVIFGKGLLWALAYLLLSYLLPESPFSYVLRMLVLAVCTVSLAYTLPGLGDRLLRGNDISYGVYIYHGLILNILFQLRLLHSAKYLLIMLVSAFAAGWVSWRLVERPFLRKKKQTLRAF